MIAALVYLAIYLAILAVVVSLLLYIVATAPWGDAQIKGIFRWAIIVIGCLIAILLLLNFVGGTDVSIRPFRP